jgi:glycerate 2-kinase
LKDRSCRYVLHRFLLFADEVTDLFSPRDQVRKTVKQTAQHVFLETLAAIQIPSALARKLDRTGSVIHAAGAAIDLRDFSEIVAIAFGKASFAMAETLTDVLAPEFPLQGILVGPTAPPRALPGWKSFVGGHPLPSAESFAAGRAILDRLGRCNERTLIFFLISGGGSAMVEQPLAPGITLEDFQKLHLALVTCGAPIEEINVIRKHLSATKGGQLAIAAPRSMKITFAISDVPEGQESALASGPTLADPSTSRDAERIALQYDLLPQLPASIRASFERHTLSETPKLGDPAFERSHFELLLGVHDLTHACHHACEAEGFICLADNSTDNWPLEKAADHLLAQLGALKKENPSRRVALLAGGEVSSPVTGEGIGGRNLAFVLACVPKIDGKKITVLSAGTDGIDGNSPAAGAVADGETLQRAREAGIEPAEFLRRSDAYNFFKILGDAIVTGPTGNNLRDLRILLAS